MNYYYLAFKYKGDVEVVRVSANEMANEMLGGTDDIIDFKLEFDKEDKDKSQYFQKTIYVYNDKYKVEFDDRDNNCLMLSAAYDGEGPNGTVKEDEIIARGLPWICIKIEDGNGKEIYNINNEYGN